MDVKIVTADGKSKAVTLKSGQTLLGKHVPGATDAKGIAVAPDLGIVALADDSATLTIPAGLDGSIRVRDREAAFSDLRQQGKLKASGNVESIRIPDGAFIVVQFGKVRLEIGGAVESVPVPAPSPAAARPAAARPAAAAGQGAGPMPQPGNVFQPMQFQVDRAPTGFNFIVWIVLSGLVSALFYWLAQYTPPPKEESEELKRFVELIAPEEPAPAPVEKMDMGGNEEEKEEAPKEEAAKDAAPPAPLSKEQKMDKVKQSGLLGMISKGALADVVGGQSFGGNLEQALGQVATGTMAGVSTARTTKGTGSHRTDIGQVNTGTGREMDVGGHSERAVASGVGAGVGGGSGAGGASSIAGEMSGSLSESSIRTVVNKNLKGVKFCYEQELNKNPGLQGKVEIEFTIGDDGAVTKYRIINTTLNNEAAEACMLRMIRRWKFPAPSKGPVTVVYPFVFISEAKG